MAKSSPYSLLPETAAMYTTANGLKEVEDSSKNLVSGDFEREYKAGMAEKTGYRRRCGWMVGALACAAVVALLWLAGLTVLREMQLETLRQDIRQLSANMIAMEVTIKSLNQSVTYYRSYEDFRKSTQDKMYPDGDEDIIVDDPDSEKNYVPIDNIDTLTVLEDESDMDDDDDELYDDGESGDWYIDENYKQTRTFELKPEDSSETTFKLNKEMDGTSINIIKEMLNKNPESEIPMAVKQSHDKPAESEERMKRSVFPEVPLEALEKFTATRDLVKTEERRTPKKYVPETVKPAKLTAHSSRTPRNSEDEIGGQRRPFIAAHFHGNTSHLNPEIHEHYKGNGLIRLAHGAHHDVWYPSPWTRATPSRPTLTHSGHVHVHHDGVYLVYVQIYYLDSHDVISWVLQRSSGYSAPETLLQCAQSAHSPDHSDRPISCFSASALFLRKGDKLAVRNTGGNRHSVMQPEKSFIGLVQLADIAEPETEL